MPRLRFGAALGVSLRPRDVGIGKPGSAPLPCFPELSLGVVEASAASGFVRLAGPATEPAIPRPQLGPG